MARLGRSFPFRPHLGKALSPSAVSVAGGLGSETDTANAGAIAVLLAGAQATETDTASSGAKAIVLTGTQAAETDTASAGTKVVTIIPNVHGFVSTTFTSNPALVRISTRRVGGVAIGAQPANTGSVSGGTR